MAKKGNVSVARAFVLLAIIIQVIAVILELLGLVSIHVYLGSLNGVLSGVLQGVYEFVVIVISVIFLLINYSAIYVRLHRKSTKARDYALLFGIIEVVVGIILLPELMTIAGVLLILGWLALEL